MADALIHPSAVIDPDARVRLATAARRTAADYDVARLAERWEMLFEELAAAKARS